MLFVVFGAVNMLHVVYGAVSGSRAPVYGVKGDL